ncbi:MAG: EAL domain-containing protein [Candidatus Competibacteraceae bacterium]
MKLKSASPDSLAGKLQRIEDLAEKLVYIKWSREFFVLLLRSAQDVLALARPREDCRRLVVLAERIERQVSEALEKGELPRGTNRERLITIVDALCRATPDLGGSESTPADEITTIPLFSRWDQGEWPSPISEKTAASLWLATPPESARDLIRRLEQRGAFQVRLFAQLTEIHALLAESRPPVALLIDLDSLPDRQAALSELPALRQALAPEIPLLFLADRGDITARLDAVDAGATGYFVNPADLPVLLETLEERALQILNHRVLIVDDHLPSAREIARWLENRGMITQVLAQPLHVLQALNNFQPSLLILSLDIKGVDGLLLAQAIRQHASFRELPLALLSARPDIGLRLATTGLSGEALLGKPPNPELLFTVIAKRLRPGSGLYRKLSQFSHLDTVSGLHNRPYFLTRLERALIATAASTQTVAIMLIALDNLRVIESQDVVAADEVVEQAAARLQGVLGNDPLAARFSDTLFAVLLSFIHQDALRATAKAVQTRLETEPYRVGGHDFELRTSIGISIAGPAMRDTAVLIQQADLACALARDSKDTRIHIQHDGQRAEPEEVGNLRQRRLLEEIREAVQQQRMTLLFQPTASLRGDATERYEVLLRMHNSEGWELLPETVFTLIKRHRIGMVLDRWVIAHSIRMLRERQAHGHSAILFINISPTILQDEELLNWLRGGLQKTGVPAANLVFEMAETTAQMNKQALLPFLQQLKAIGCGLSLDHFSGHERAQALAQFLRVDYVKLDAKYAHDLINDKERQQQLNQLCRSLADQGITTIVTGVEDASALPALWACGVDYVQGFFLQRPHTDLSYNFDQTVL